MSVKAMIQSKPSIVSCFYNLGERIRTKWSKYDFREDALPEIACEELDSLSLHKTFSPSDVLELALKSDPAISALQVDSPFGDLQIIPYRHARFFIEILYWVEGTTAIHDHGFSGAFSVLSGSTINAEYKFKTIEKINHHFYLGNLSNPLIKKLIPGSVQPIHSGSRFIHAAFHLENPTISVVVRTHQDDDAMPQYEYRGGHLKLISEFAPEFSKRIKSLRLLESIDKDRFYDSFKDVLLDSPTDERYWLCRAFFMNLKKHEKSLCFLDFMRAKDVRMSYILDSIEDEKLLRDGIKQRARINDAELRYFMALLLNIPSWSDILQYLQQHHGNSSILIESWLNRCKQQGFSLPKSAEQLISSNTISQNIVSDSSSGTLDMKTAIYNLIDKRMRYSSTNDAN